MVFVVPDPSGLAQGISTVGQAFGQALQSANQARRDKEMREALMEKEYEQKGLLQLQKSALEQALEKQKYDIWKNKIASGNLFGHSQSQDNLFEATDTMVVDSTAPGPQPLLTNNSAEIDYAQKTNLPIQYAKNDPAKELSDQELIALASSPDKTTSKYAEALLESRNNTKKDIAKKADYGFKVNKTYLDQIEKERKSSKNIQSNIQQIETAIKSGDLSPFGKEWWNQAFSMFGVDLLGPEGKLLDVNVKDLFINTTGEVKGRPNIYLEKQIRGALPSIGAKDSSNLTNMASFRIKNKALMAKVEMTDRLANEEYQKYGHLQPNLAGRVEKALKPIYEQLQNEQVYEIRRAQEVEAGIDKLINKKPVRGTPLTMNMFSAMRKKFDGDGEKAIKYAKKMGYLIFDKDEMRRLHNESSFKR